jgi:hypothetical protein
MPKVYESAEKLAIYVEKFRDFLIFDEETTSRLLGYLDTRAIEVSKHRDSNGSKAIMYNYSRLTDEVRSDDWFRLFSCGGFSIYFEPETQIGGVMTVVDARNFQLKYLPKVPTILLYDMAKNLSHFHLRVVKIMFVGVPTFATLIFETVVKFFSSKIQERTKTLKDVTELHEIVDASLLSEELGGSESNCLSIEELKATIKMNIKRYNEYFSLFGIDWERYKKFKGAEETELVGSFRKLEVD